MKDDTSLTQFGGGMDLSPYVVGQVLYLQNYGHKFLEYCRSYKKTKRHHIKFKKTTMTLKMLYLSAYLELCYKTELLTNLC